MDQIAMGMLCVLLLWLAFRPAKKAEPEPAPKPAVKRVKVQRRRTPPQWGAWDDTAWDGLPIVPWEEHPATKKHWWQRR